jgi:uncharacterized protein (DUF427 family)
MEPSGHTIELREDGRRIEIMVDGVLIASTTGAVSLHETGLPPRHYLPRGDVQVELRSTDKGTTCPFKGAASYWSIEVDGNRHENLVWAYEDPIEGMEAIKGRIAFFDERVDVVIDGEPQPRPTTQWTPGTIPPDHP